MKRIDSEDAKEPGPAREPLVRTLDFAIRKTAPGLMYRCVPQDDQSPFLRINTEQMAIRPVNGPDFVTSRRLVRDPSLSELFFG